MENRVGIEPTHGGLKARRLSSWLPVRIGWRGWARTSDILLNRQAQLPLCYTPIMVALEGRIERPSSVVQADALTVELPKRVLN